MMRCELFAELLGAEALDHAARCPRCARALAEARSLDLDLAALAASTEVVPPARLRDTLRAAVRERAAPRARRRVWAQASIAAALVGIALLAAVYFRTGSAPAATPVAQVADATGFIPLDDYEITELDGMFVVRVQLEDAMLAELGLSADAGAVSDLLDAEVLLGPDGVARAIRFVE